MSPHPPFQSGPTLVEQATGHTDIPGQPAHARWTAESAIPARCTDTELYHGLGYSRPTFYRLKALGGFKFLEVDPQLPGGATVYSGRLIQKWLRGDRAGQPRQFFAGARGK